MIGGVLKTEGVKNGVGSGLKGRNTRKKTMEKGGEQKEKRENGMRRKRKEKRMTYSLHPGLSGPSHLKGDFLKF